jgi:AmmeMemoRadiSam system protein A
VRRNACRAAFEDPRFEPLSAAEWPQVRLEVSVLGRPTALGVRSEAEALAALRPGEDGVILAWRGQRATFLPQVWAQLPTPAEFLAALRRKAGLPVDFWAPDLALSRCHVQAFAEDGFSP